MKEKDFQTKFGRWVKNRWQGSAVFELKLCKDKAWPFSEIKEHQLAALSVAKHSILYFKLPDVGLMQKPFDTVVVSGVPAYLALMFYKRGQDEFFLIDIDTLLSEIKSSERRSLTEDRAQLIGQSVHFA